MLEDSTAPAAKRVNLVPFLAGLLTASVMAAAAYFFLLPRLAPAPLTNPARTPGAAAHATGANSLAPLVAEEYASLNIKPHTTVLTTDKAMSAAEALRHGDYQSAETMTQGILAQTKMQAFSFSPFYQFIDHLSLGDDPQFLDGVNAWVSNRPQSAFAYLVRATYFCKTAWLIRGEDFSAAVPAEHMRLFNEYLERAASDVRQSINLDAKIPSAYLLRLQISEVHDEPRDVEQVFLDGITRYPDYYPLYRVRLDFLQPKWGGSAAAMYQFVTQYAAGAPPSSPRNLLYLQLAADFLNEAWIECEDFKHEQLTQCMDAYLNRHVGAGLTDGVTKALNLYKFSDPIQYSNALWRILGEMVNTPGDHQSINTLLQLAADAMGSNNELIHDSKHNNYVIDDITARVWAQIGNANNVEQKFREALDDVEHMPFANEDDKSEVLGQIYDHMTWVARSAAQYVKVIPTTMPRTRSPA